MTFRDRDLLSAVAQSSDQMGGIYLLEKTNCWFLEYLNFCQLWNCFDFWKSIWLKNNISIKVAIWLCFLTASNARHIDFHTWFTKNFVIVYFWNNVFISISHGFYLARRILLECIAMQYNHLYVFVYLNTVRNKLKHSYRYCFIVWTDCVPCNHINVWKLSQLIKFRKQSKSWRK